MQQQPRLTSRDAVNMLYIRHWTCGEMNNTPTCHYGSWEVGLGVNTPIIIRFDKVPYAYVQYYVSLLSKY